MLPNPTNLHDRGHSNEEVEIMSAVGISGFVQHIVASMAEEQNLETHESDRENKPYPRS